MSYCSRAGRSTRVPGIVLSSHINCKSSWAPSSAACLQRAEVRKLQMTTSERLLILVSHHLSLLCRPRFTADDQTAWLQTLVCGAPPLSLPGSIHTTPEPLAGDWGSHCSQVTQNTHILQCPTWSLHWTWTHSHLACLIGKCCAALWSPTRCCWGEPLSASCWTAPSASPMWYVT